MATGGSEAASLGRPAMLVREASTKEGALATIRLLDTRPTGKLALAEAAWAAYRFETPIAFALALDLPVARLPQEE